MTGELIQELLSDELLTAAPLTPEEKYQVALLAAYQAENALKRQTLINDEVRRIGITADKHGSVRRIAIIDPTIVHQNRAIHGNNIWSDPDFVKGFLKDNPKIKLPE